ncbi:hypothetical protein EJ06DRAFT_554711 [Trichodelitschia bisporula]|uniref:Uncharacterized protein n=1 Tax=Trichodelitschia bisporula TaxID=703511 RepID=A0A6G1I4G3_9PEZI|nr:hypothetical protein EJ06DRAFT_554711 [Trichodelitschia bisporula]
MDRVDTFFDGEGGALPVPCMLAARGDMTYLEWKVANGLDLKKDPWLLAHLFESIDPGWPSERNRKWPPPPSKGPPMPPPLRMLLLPLPSPPPPRHGRDPEWLTEQGPKLPSLLSLPERDLELRLPPLRSLLGQDLELTLPPLLPLPGRDLGLRLKREWESKQEDENVCVSATASDMANPRPDS